jgi:hypothetical protein
MTTRILFNGQEYASAEAMPDDVRKAYQQALAQLADADHNGIPDILERGGAGNVIGIQNSSITVNGKTYGSVGEMPALVRFLYEQAMGQLDPNRAGALGALGGLGALGAPSTPDAAEGAVPKVNGEPAPAADAPFMRALDQTESVLSTILVILLAGAAGAVIVFGSWMITHMDESERSQGGVLYVGLAMAVVLGAIASGFVNLWWRRRR